MKKRLVWIGICVFLAVVAIFAATQFAVIKSHTKKPTVRIGYVNLAASLPLFVAHDAKLFEEEGLAVEMIEFKSGNDLAVAGATKQLDVMATLATNAAIDAMSTSNSRFRVFMVNTYKPANDQGLATDYLLARPGLNIGDLRNRTIAFFPGSVSRVAARIVLRKHGLNEKDYRYLELSPPQWLPSLKSGQIDAVLGIEPFATQIMDEGVAVPVIRGFLNEMSPTPPLSAFWFTANLEDAHTQDAVVKVFRKAVSQIEQDNRQSRDILTKRTAIAPDVASRITLNDWRFVDDPDVINALEKFVQVLGEEQAIKPAPPSSEWIWQK